MNVLLGITRSRDALLKESLQTQLISCVKDIQLDHAHSGRFVSSTEAAQSLCTVIEAIFIHGIKETLADKVAIAMGDPDVRPEPNFWPALLVFSHREIIDQIGRLTFVTTDIGRCRAWLRMALNENLLSSYLQSMLAQNRPLNSFYKRAAYLRDNELLDMLITLVSSIESHPFNFVCNSSLLNLWSNQPLLMSGVWSPAMKPSPIISGRDIVSSLVDQDLPQVDQDSLSSAPSMSSLFESSPRSNTFDEDEVLKKILAADENLGDEVFSQHGSPARETSGNSIVESKDNNLNYDKGYPATLSDDAILDANKLPSADLHCEQRDDIQVLEPNIVDEYKIKATKKQVQSYHSLVESYNKTSTSTSPVPHITDLLQKFHSPITPVEQPMETSADYHLDTADFEKLDYFDPSEVPEFGTLMMHISRIPTEPGLDYQNYKCKACSQEVGLNFTEAKVCGLSGAYYCSECFSTELWLIPARIIYNWDFRQYSVSHNAANFLLQTKLYPMFDLNALNSKIYDFVQEMARLKELRKRLKYLGDYLKSCKENTSDALQRLLWPRQYIYENIHHYSLADLIQVPSGDLESVLHRAVVLAQSHVVSCTFCSQQGFICEICKNPQVIFPFELDSTYRCEECGTVYHAQCLESGKACNKCSRICQRELKRRNSSTSTHHSVS